MPPRAERGGRLRGEDSRNARFRGTRAGACPSYRRCVDRPDLVMNLVTRVQDSLQGLKNWDAARPAIPGEHLAAFGAGALLLLFAARRPSKMGAKIRQRMTRERSQWLYFDRNLFLFEGPRTFVLKPMQRLWGTESQALVDADHLVAAALASAGEVQ